MEKRLYKMTVPLSESEHEKILCKARACGRVPSEFVRAAALMEADRAPEEKEASELLDAFLREAAEAGFLEEEEAQLMRPFLFILMEGAK